MSTILIGGGTGFVGSFLCRRLRRDGHEVRILTRSPKRDAEFPMFRWDILNNEIDDQAFNGVDVIVNLTGAGIADKRWSEDRKLVIINSRTQSTRLLAETITRLQLKPDLYVSASAIGFYGDRGERLLTEQDESGEGFLSKSCVLWEEAAREIEALGHPTFINRTGIVLHPDHGALQKMLLPLNAFTSTYFGDGQQYYSWIHVEDLVDLYAYAIEHRLTGIYNGTAPNPVRNKHFAEALPLAMDKRAIVISAPVPALKLALGEMSHTVLDSARCSAEKIQGAGFRFTYPELSQALGQLLRS